MRLKHGIHVEEADADQLVQFHYSRADVFWRKVNKQPMKSVTFEWLGNS